MKVWELIASLEEAKAGSLVCIALPDGMRKARLDEGIDADFCVVDNGAGIVTIHTKVSS